MSAWSALNEDFHRAQTEVFGAMENCRSELVMERLKMETLIANMPDGLVMLNLRGDVLYLNHPAVSMLGIRPADIRAVKRGIYELVDTDRYRMLIQNILKNNTHRSLIELPDARRSNSRRFYRTMVTMFALPDGVEFGVMLILRDITEEIQLEVRKEEFFRNVAHDLRSPICDILGYLRLLEKSIQFDNHQKSCFDAISRSCERIISYVNDTLDFLRIETGHFKLTTLPVAPVGFMRRFKELFDFRAGEKGVRLELKIQGDIPDTIPAQEKLLERVLDKLLANALKFSPREGTITLGIARAGEDQVEFSVQDAGPGIPADQKTRIFDKFQPGQDQANPDGFWSSLPFCFKIVQVHKGSMWVDSEVGLGSRFVFTIPISQKTEG